MQSDLMLIHSRSVSSRREKPDLNTTGNLHVKALRLLEDTEGKRKTQIYEAKQVCIII